MTIINDVTTTYPDVELLETSDLVLGGIDGASNKQAIALAKRDHWLKTTLEALIESNAQTDAAQAQGIVDLNAALALNELNDQQQTNLISFMQGLIAGLQAQYNSEATARYNGDAHLQSQINTLNTRTAFTPAFVLYLHTSGTQVVTYSIGYKDESLRYLYPTFDISSVQWVDEDGIGTDHHIKLNVSEPDWKLFDNLLVTVDHMSDRTYSLPVSATKQVTSATTCELHLHQYKDINLNEDNINSGNHKFLIKFWAV